MYNYKESGPKSLVMVFYSMVIIIWLQEIVSICTGWAGGDSSRLVQIITQQVSGAAASDLVCYLCSAMTFFSLAIFIVFHYRVTHSHLEYDMFIVKYVILLYCV